MVGFNATAVLPQNFQPNWNSKCVLWLRADLGTTIATGVSTWLDKSSNSYSFTQATGSAQPTLNTSDSSYNKQATLSFNSAASQYVRATVTTLPQPYTCLVVGENSSGSTQAQFNGWIGNNTGPYWTGTQWGLYAGVGFSVTNTVTTKQAQAAVFNTTTSAIYINNSQTAAGTGSAGATSGGAALTIGANAASASPLNGKVAEMIVISSALTTSQIKEIFAYFGARYNISTS